MDKLNFFIQNWALIIAVIALIGVVIWAIIQFVQLPTKNQLAKVQEWLLWAVTKAEGELGEKTGQLKLRYVYDMFVAKFPAVAKFISFEYFSMMVDRALDKMRDILDSNEAAEKLVLTGEKTVSNESDSGATPEAEPAETADEEIDGEA